MYRIIEIKSGCAVIIPFTATEIKYQVRCGCSLYSHMYKKNQLRYDLFPYISHREKTPEKV